MSVASIKGAACESSPRPLPAVRPRSRDRTTQELQYAILRVKNKGARMSIRAVALEAGVDPSLLHNTYPDIAEEIRALVGRATRRQRDEARADMAALRRHLHDVTAERDEIKKAMAVLVSVNLVLHDQIAELRAELGGKIKRMVPGPS
jgi:AcrR family transcriptional regulator